MSEPPTAVARGDADQIRALQVQTPGTLTASLIGVALLGAIFWPLAPRQHLLAWIAAAALLWAFRLAHHLRFRMRRGADTAAQQRWRVGWSMLVLAQGALWGVAVWLFWGLGTPYHVLSLVLIVYSYCLGSVQLLAAQQGVLLSFLSLAMAPTIARVASDDSQPWHLELAVVLTLLFGITVLMGRSYGHALAQAIRLKTRTDDLALRLRAESAEAERARREAEAATLAKTQFFAAASHDLRQPLHAMGLFAEALRQRTHEPAVAALVNSINESVDALEGLFSELLDITRIDSGGVEVKPAPVRLREVFARLRLHFEPVAFEKGLMLGFRGERHVAQADPVLLERVLRNLLANAIRYTEDGGVLVSCRPRGGHLLLQVWDSGIGIDAANLPRIWDEFFQVRGARPLQPHDRKGLGLGLAIVQRLAQLMEAPIAVRSRVGHGTVFAIELPIGQPPRDAPPLPPSARAMPALTLDGRRIVVVEDEPAVRDGLAVLLHAWGAEVRAFDGLEAVEAALASGAEPPPDLLLVDYRLPNGRTGVDALRALRAHWPQRRLPAVVITGSSLSGHENETATDDFHVLLKPVLPGKLRAMIAFKLGAGVSR